MCVGGGDGGGSYSADLEWGSREGRGGEEWRKAAKQIKNASACVSEEEGGKRRSQGERKKAESYYGAASIFMFYYYSVH